MECLYALLFGTFKGDPMRYLLCVALGHYILIGIHVFESGLMPTALTSKPLVSIAGDESRHSCL